MTLLFPTPAPILAKTVDGAVFPVNRIFCVGRNYAEHAREMGTDPEREPPFFVTKWAQTVVPAGTALAYPAATANFHYEAELVVAIGTAGANIPAAAANIPQSNGSSLMTTLNEDLGLKLDSVRAPVDVVIIDSVEAPTPD